MSYQTQQEKPGNFGELTGTYQLFVATLKHEWRSMLIWAAIVTFLSVSSIIAFDAVFPEQADRLRLNAAISSNPALGLVFGPVETLMSADGFNAWRSLALGGFMTALCAIFAVSKSARAQEDSGQAELLASGVLGRSARLLVAVLMGLLSSLVIGLVAGGATVLVGGGAESTWLLAATWVATGWLFTAVTALTCQLGADVRTANSLAVGTFGTLYVLRGFAYAVDGPGWSIWINPLGWMMETKVAGDNLWTPLLLPLGLALLVLVSAFILQARRDFGQGVIAQRPGRARGRIHSTYALAFALNRSPIMVWSIAFALLGVIFGYMSGSITELLGSDSTVQAILASGAADQSSLVSAFLVTIISLIGIIATIPGIQFMLKLRSEEMDDRVEPILAGSVRRYRLFGAYTLLTLITTAFYVLLAGSILASFAVSADIGVSFGDAFTQALVTIPAVWTVVGLASALVGACPKLEVLAWLGVIVSFVITLLGNTLGLSEAQMAVSPFDHIPSVIVGESGWGLLWISLITAAFLVVGFAGFSRRDIAR